MFSGVFRGDKMGILARYGLIFCFYFIYTFLYEVLFKFWRVNIKVLFIYFHINMFERFRVNHKLNKFPKCIQTNLHLRFVRNKFEIRFNFSKDPLHHCSNPTHGFVIFVLVRCHISISIGSLEVNKQRVSRITIYTKGFTMDPCHMLQVYEHSRFL